MTPRMITQEDAAGRLDWAGVVEALRDGHRRPRAQIGDLFLGPSDGALLTRGAFIDGLGYGVKSVTVFGGNPRQGLPTVQGAMFVFEPDHGALTAIIESALVTWWKTAADSVLGARLLARPDSETLLILGAGQVARSLIEAYAAEFPKLRRIRIWARRAEQAAALAHDCGLEGISVSAADDLAQAAGEADIIASATMAREPVLKGAWVRPGTHVDLIGAFRKDMREADDDLIANASLFVDSRETTLDHIGELAIPIARGVLCAEAVRGDLYDLIAGAAPGRRSGDEVTVSRTAAARILT